jgi:hypothetical protein
MFVGVACSSEPTDQPLPLRNFQAQPNQPTRGALTNPSGQVNPVPGQPGLIGGPGIVGTVKSVSGNTIQLTGQDGNAITVQVDDKTAYQKNVTGTIADIQTGLRLIVTAETSGSVIKAQSIQIASSGGPTGGTPEPRRGQPPQAVPPAPPGAVSRVSEALNQVRWRSLVRAAQSKAFPETRFVNDLRRKHDHSSSRFQDGDSEIGERRLVGRQDGHSNQRNH